MVNPFKIQINSNRIYGLDILRFLAIFFVVFGHGNFFFPEKISQYLDLIVFDGVGIFFVLSGFLIGSILIKEIGKEDFSIINFWRNRWFRTLPTYFLILLLLIIIRCFSKANFQDINLWQYFVFSQNLFYPHPQWFPEAWSLSVEEWFYITIPLILLLGIKFKLKVEYAILFVVILLLISITTLRIYKFYSVDVKNLQDWDLFYRKQVIMRLDSLMYGVLGAYLYKFKPQTWIINKKKAFVFGVLLLCINKFFIEFDIHSFYSCVLLFSIDSLGTLLLLPFLNSVKSGKGILFKCITTISLISYSMYLINFSLVKNHILELIIINTNNKYLNFSILYLLFWILTILLSILLYNYFELPMTNLRNRYNKNKND